LGEDDDFSKESITLGCQKSFLVKNHAMYEKKNHLRSKMLVGLLLVEELHLLATMVVDLSAMVVKGHLGGGAGGGPPKNGSSEPQRDQNPKTYAIRPTRLWIGPT
jgi:hypothetical protein